MEPISLVVPTRGRPHSLCRSLPTFLANLDDLAELVIVDQSLDDRTASVVAPYTSRPKVRYLRFHGGGLSVARNFGCHLVSTPLVAFTDDDCLIPEGWARSVSDQMVEGEIGAFFGAVVAEPFDWRIGHTPSAPYLPERNIQNAEPGSIPGIMGANMAIRRDALLRVGGFDPYLGAGARFKAAEEVDLTYRLLLAGYRVAVRPTPAVIHFGFRTYASGQSREVVRATHRGVSAYLAKHARVGDLRAMRAYVGYLANTSRQVIGNVRRGQRPFGFTRIALTLFGFVDSFKYRVDRDRRLFTDRARETGAHSSQAPLERKSDKETVSSQS